MLVQGCQNCVLKMSGNVRVTAGYRHAQAQEEPFLSGVTEIFCKIESNFLNFRVLASGFVMGCAKKSWF